MCDIWIEVLSEFLKNMSHKGCALTVLESNRGQTEILCIFFIPFAFFILYFVEGGYKLELGNSLSQYAVWWLFPLDHSRVLANSDFLTNENLHALVSCLPHSWASCAIVQTVISWFPSVWRCLACAHSSSLENSKSKLTSPLPTQSPIFFVEFRISQPEDELGVVGQMKYWLHRWTRWWRKDSKNVPLLALTVQLRTGCSLV